MTAIRSFLNPNVRLALPGTSRERDRLLRLAGQLNLSHLIIRTDGQTRFEDLVAVADLAVVVPTGEVPVGVIAWAMASGVPVIGSAVYSVAELLAENLNARLVRPAPAKRLATVLARVAGEPEPLRRLAEVARGQAYEVFSLRRYVDQVDQLYDNLMTGRPTAEGICDPALVGA